MVSPFEYNLGILAQLGSGAEPRSREQFQPARKSHGSRRIHLVRAARCAFARDCTLASRQESNEFLPGWICPARFARLDLPG
jgi:hypothetical protein